MEHIAPLVQTVLWVGLIGIALWRFYAPIYGILTALQRRVEGGSNFRAGFLEVSDNLRPQDPAKQKEKVSSEIREALQSTTAGDAGLTPVGENDRVTALRAKYFQAEDLALRAIQAEYGEPVSRQVTAGSDVGFDGAFVKNGRMNIVEVKFLRGPSGNVSRLQPSIERLARTISGYGWRNVQIILAVVFEKAEEVARANALLNGMALETQIPIEVRCYALSDLQSKFGMAEQ